MLFNENGINKKIEEVWSEKTKTQIEMAKEIEKIKEKYQIKIDEFNQKIEAYENEKKKKVMNYLEKIKPVELKIYHLRTSGEDFEIQMGNEDIYAEITGSFTSGYMKEQNIEYVIYYGIFQLSGGTLSEKTKEYDKSIQKTLEILKAEIENTASFRLKTLFKENTVIIEKAPTKFAKLSNAEKRVWDKYMHKKEDAQDQAILNEIRQRIY